MFQSVQSNRVSEEIARQIKQVILSGQLKPGDKLPSERELVEQFRSALQQAHVGGGLTLHVVNFHRAIYNALCQRDGARASRLMAEHIADIQSRLQPLLSKGRRPAAWPSGPPRLREVSWDH